MIDINQIQELPFVKAKLKEVFGSDETEVLVRHAEDGTTTPTSYFIKRKNEQGLDVERIIILPPHGFTANMPTWMNSHEEAHDATIDVLGGARFGKITFSKLKDCLELAHAPKANSSAALNVPYMETSGENVQKTKITSGVRVYVVKPDGFGFYHNLTNTTNDWLVLKLEKHLRPMKGVDVSAFPKSIESLANEFYAAVKQHGDEIFHKQPDLVARIVDYENPHQTIPALIEMLKIYDAGKHEACTVFATLLQIGKKHPAVFHEYAQLALDEHFEPAFYLKQLIQKIDHATDAGRADGQTWVTGAPSKGEGFAKRLR
jgi:hypothetical protein